MPTKNMLEQITEHYEAASPEEKEKIKQSLSPVGPVNPDEILTPSDLDGLIEEPLQTTLAEIIPIMGTELMKFPFAVLETEEPLGFITSDNPVIWADPRTYENPRPRFAGGLVSPTIEITMPLSPSQAVFFAHKMPWPNKYVPIDGTLLANVNRSSRLNADEYIVLRKNEIRASWFDI